MAQIYEIPLASGAQKFSAVIGGKRCNFTLTYRLDAYGGAWYLDVVRADAIDGVTGMVLDCGIDLFAQHGYKGLGRLWLERTDGSTARPSYEDVGSVVRLLWSEE